MKTAVADFAQKTRSAMEPGLRFRIKEFDEWNFEGANHVVRTAKDFEDYARDCVRLAEQVDSPELREKLLQQAREWMHALIDEEDASGATGK